MDTWTVMISVVDCGDACFFEFGVGGVICCLVKLSGSFAAASCSLPLSLVATASNAYDLDWPKAPLSTSIGRRPVTLNGGRRVVDDCCVGKDCSGSEVE